MCNTAQSLCKHLKFFRVWSVWRVRGHGGGRVNFPWAIRHQGRLHGGGDIQTTLYTFKKEFWGWQRKEFQAKRTEKNNFFRSYLFTLTLSFVWFCFGFKAGRCSNLCLGCLICKMEAHGCWKKMLSDIWGSTVIRFSRQTHSNQGFIIIRPCGSVIR